MSIMQNENLSLNASVLLQSDEEDPGKIVRSLMKEKLKYRKAKKKWEDCNIVESNTSSVEVLALFSLASYKSLEVFLPTT